MKNSKKLNETKKNLSGKAGKKENKSLVATNVAGTTTEIKTVEQLVAEGKAVMRTYDGTIENDPMYVAPTNQTSLVVKEEEKLVVNEEETKLEENKPDDKKIEDKKPKVELTESEKSKNIITGLVAKNPTLKIVATEAKTGISFFSGKKRLCKLLNTKRGVTIEINVSLPKEFKELPDMENISATTAFKKHLGTMKHLYKAGDSKQVAAIMKEAIAVFKAEIEAAKAEDNKVVNG